MGLEVAIFIGDCTDVYAIDKMIKAAYIYADIVRVYDFSLPIGYRKGDVFYNIYAEIEKKVDKKYEQMYNRYPFLGDKELNYKEIEKNLLELSPEEMEELSIRLDRLAKMRGFLFDKHIFFDQFERFHDQRKKNNEQYDNIRFQEEMTRMGIIHFGVVVEKCNNPFSVHKAYDNLCSRYFDDKGVKIVSDAEYLTKKGLDTSSVWVPGFLAEYTISLLPGFEEATLDEIIDIRNELDKYIIPFRAVLIFIPS